MNIKGEKLMNCPICNNTTGIEIDIHSDGYAKDIVECTNCEALWLYDMNGITMLNKKVA
jgi:transcription elongation factor Elf1